MRDAIEATAYLDFDTEAILKAVKIDGVEVALEIAAKQLVDDAESRFMQLHQETGSGEMMQGFFDFKSFFADGGWIAGVFDKPGPWAESVGGRAHFFEYGRSAPGRGRESSGKADARSKRAQPPRPFMRPARNKMKRKIGGLIGKEVTIIARKLNRSKQADKFVQREINRIK